MRETRHQSSFNKRENKMRLAILAAVVALSGCVPVPMNPTEFRAAVNTEGRNIDKFEVNRPFADVIRTFQKMTPECLNYSVTTTEKRGLIGGRTTSDTWAWVKGTLSVSQTRMELRIQRKIKDQVGTYPDDGMYYLVADARPVGAGKTKMAIYYWDDVAAAARAMKGWASGGEMGCPDPAQLF